MTLVHVRALLNIENPVLVVLLVLESKGLYCQLQFLMRLTAKRELKQRPFCATQFNRKWTFYVPERSFRSNFQSNRLFKSKETKKYQFYIANAYIEGKTSLPVDLRRSETPLLKLPIY